MKITQITGEPTRFHIQSRSNPKHSHLIDLAENAPYGGCTCASHTMKLWPEYRKLKDKPQMPRRCPHLQLARETALNLTLEHFQHTSQ